MNGKILDTVKGPQDVKKLTDLDKRTLCGEIRSKIVETVSVTGGHLASNLGVVELTVALLSSFHVPEDSIVWDVGHQCYAYKLLTGRAPQFHSLRTKGGVSGFPSREESDCDPFTSGHSSTSISAALGISAANQVKNDPSYTVAVIGDGSLTGGLAFEGLNNAGRRKKNFIVILNDNHMSISRNVGSMARYLGYIRTKPSYIRAKIGVEAAFNHMPVVGAPLARMIRWGKNLVKKNFYNSTIFEDMGFAYYGPFDGHDLPTLTETLAAAKQIRKPVVIHIRTTKGKGYDFAESNPKDFHGVPSFDAFSGKLEPSKASFSSVFGNCLVNMAASDPRLCAVTAAMALGTGLYEFSQNYKERFFDVGIAEGHAVTFAAGLARRDLIPVFAVYSTFLQRAYDNLMHDVALQKLKVILAVDRAGLIGEDGRTHQGVFDVGFLKTIPGTVVFSPSYYDELEQFLQEAVRGPYGLVALRYPRGGEGFRPRGFVSSYKAYDCVGKGEAALCIVTYGREFSHVAEAAEQLGDNVKILKLNRIFPLCPAAVQVAASAQKVLFVEESAGGIAEHFGAALHRCDFKGSFRTQGIDCGFVPHASMAEQFSALGLDAQGVAQAVQTSFLKG